MKTFVLIGLIVLQIVGFSGCGKQVEEKNDILISITSSSWLAQQPTDQYLFAACENATGKYGFIDSTGSWVVQPNFDETPLLIPYLTLPQMDLLPAKLGDKWGYIDRSGTWIIEPQYQSVRFFEQDIASVNFADTNKYGWIDSSGNTLTNPIEGMVPFSDGLSLDGKLGEDGDHLYGYINKQGEWAIDPQFLIPKDLGDNVRRYKFSFSEGFSVAFNGEQYGMINKKGNWHLPPQYEDLLPFTEGVAAARMDGLWGYIDHKGKWVIAPRFENAKIFTEGLAAICINDRWGFIDHSGKIAIPPDYGLEYEEYLYFLGFHEQLAVVWDINEGTKEESLLGYIGQSGEWEIPPQFQSAEPFCNGVAFVKKLNAENVATVGYINKKGDYLMKWTE